MQASPTTLALPRLSADFAITGDPASWGANALDIRTFSESSSTPIDPDVLSADARLGWTPRGLVALITIRTPGPWREAETPMNGYNADSIELLLHDSSDAKKLVQAIITPGMIGDHPEPRSVILGKRISKDGAKDALANLEIKRVRTATGCVVEALFPWSAIGLDAAEGARCEVLLKINKILPNEGRHQLIWANTDGGGFSSLRLAEPGHSVVDTAAWITIDERNFLAVSMVGPASAKGKSLRLLRGDAELLRVPLQGEGGEGDEGGRAVAIGWIQPPAPGNPPLSVFLDSVQVATADVPDIVSTLRDKMQMMALYPNSWNEDWLRSGVYLHVPSLFMGTSLPALVTPDARVARLVGVQETRVDWFGPDGQPVTDAKIPGRYGAIITAHLSGADPIVFHQTCFRLPDAIQPADVLSNLARQVGAKGSLDPRSTTMLADLGGKTLQRLADNASAATLLAALSEAAVDGKPARPTARDSDWWYAVRTRFGDATTYHYFSSLPDGYLADPKKRWPAIIYLHGTSGPLPRNYPPIEKRNPNSDLLGWSKGKKLPIAIYALESFGRWEPAAVDNAIDKILATDRIDPDRVIIMGFSMGGMGTWDCAIDHPERFAAAVPIAAGANRLSDCSTLAGRLPIWVFNGDADGIMRLDAADKMVNALKAAGGNVKLTILPGVDHGGSQDGTFTTPGLWAWIEVQRRVGSSAK